MAACAPRPAGAFAPLIQIRRTVEAECGPVSLSLEAASGAWSVRVSDRDGRTLYTAQRSSLNAAQAAATEFALWTAGIPCQGSPEATARQLTWREGW